MSDRCDFCGSTAVRWIYPCRPFYFMFIFPMSGQWLACEVCRLLIEANETEALALRANNTLRAKLPFIPDDPTDMHKIHDLFRMHRTGPATPYREDPS
jgi:hypothetical protein